MYSLRTVRAFLPRGDGHSRDRLDGQRLQNRYFTRLRAAARPNQMQQLRLVRDYLSPEADRQPGEELSGDLADRQGFPEKQQIKQHKSFACMRRSFYAFYFKNLFHFHVEITQKVLLRNMHF